MSLRSLAFLGLVQGERALLFVKLRKKGRGGFKQPLAFGSIQTRAIGPWPIVSAHSLVGGFGQCHIC